MLRRHNYFLMDKFARSFNFLQSQAANRGLTPKRRHSRSKSPYSTFAFARDPIDIRHLHEKTGLVRSLHWR